MEKTFLTLLLLASVLFTSPYYLQAQRLPQPGDVVISEIMINPAMVSDTKGEWIEILNLSTDTLLLNGLILSDEGSNRHVLTSDADLLLKPQAYYVLARNENPEENGGTTSDYAYSNYSLGNTEDEIILSTSEDLVLDAVAYTSDWSFISGSSMELNQGSEDPAQNDDSNNWHPAQTAYGDGDLGTPGRANSISSAIHNEKLLEYFDAFPNPCLDDLSIRISSDHHEKIHLRIINILGQSSHLLTLGSGEHRRLNVDLSSYPKGYYWIEARSAESHQTIRIIRK